MNLDFPTNERFQILYRAAVGMLFTAALIEIAVPLSFGMQVLSSPAMIGIHFCAGFCIFLFLGTIYAMLKENRIARGEAKPFFSKQEEFDKKQTFVFLIVVLYVSIAPTAFALYCMKNTYFCSQSFVNQIIYLVLGFVILISVGVAIANFGLKTKKS